MRRLLIVGAGGHGRSVAEAHVHLGVNACMSGGSVLGRSAWFA